MVTHTPLLCHVRKNLYLWLSVFMPRRGRNFGYSSWMELDRFLNSGKREGVLLRNWGNQRFRGMGCNRLPDRLHDRLPDRLRDRLPDRLHDRLPDRLRDTLADRHGDKQCACCTDSRIEDGIRCPDEKERAPEHSGARSLWCVWSCRVRVLPICSCSDTVEAEEAYQDVSSALP